VQVTHKRCFERPSSKTSVDIPTYARTAIAQKSTVKEIGLKTNLGSKSDTTLNAFWRQKRANKRVESRLTQQKYHSSPGTVQSWHRIASCPPIHGQVQSMTFHI